MQLKKKESKMLQKAFDKLYEGGVYNWYQHGSLMADI